ncbi:MAG TPA: histidine phosphatase family protein [Acidimicrobiia bacterium]|nr:histidine phosphatase family protein [Acidimicrobiia bacterium]
MSVLVFARHGETDANANGLLLGRLDPPLNERGRAQAEALARAFGAGARPAVVATSPLARTRATAEAIAAACGVEVEVDERLVEVDYGVWDGHPFGALPVELVRKWRSDPAFTPEGGESLADVRARMARCASDLLERAAEAGAPVVAVSHVSPIKAAVLWALALDDTFAWRLRLDVASITRLTPGPDGPVLLTFNETGHLR